MTNLIRNIDKLITSSGTEVDFENIQAGGGSVELPFNIYEEGGDTNIDFNSTSVADNIVSVVSIEQTNSYELFTFNWLIIRIPVSRYQWEQVYSYDSLEDLQCEFIESPPTLRQNLIRSYLQVYVI